MKSGRIIGRSEVEAMLEWHVGLTDKMKAAMKCNEISGIKLIPWQEKPEYMSVPSRIQASSQHLT